MEADRELIHCHWCGAMVPRREFEEHHAQDVVDAKLVLMEIPERRYMAEVEEAA